MYKYAVSKRNYLQVCARRVYANSDAARATVVGLVVGHGCSNDVSRLASRINERHRLTIVSRTLQYYHTVVSLTWRRTRILKTYIKSFLHPDTAQGQICGCKSRVTRLHYICNSIANFSNYFALYRNGQMRQYACITLLVPAFISFQQVLFPLRYVKIYLLFKPIAKHKNKNKSINNFVIFGLIVHLITFKQLKAKYLNISDCPSYRASPRY